MMEDEYVILWPDILVRVIVYEWPFVRTECHWPTTEPLPPWKTPIEIHGNGMGLLESLTNLTIVAASWSHS